MMIMSIESLGEDIVHRPLTALTVVAVVAALIQGSFSAASASAASLDLAEGFNDGAASWMTANGTATVASSAGDKTEGNNALTFGYDVTATNAEIGRITTPPTLPSVPIRSMVLDVKGDSTYNTLYLKLRDATGEMFMYRVSTLNVVSWTSITVDLTKPPALTSGGNSNGVLDAPLSVYRLTVARNGSQPAVGQVKVDNLRTVSDGWGLDVAGESSRIEGGGPIMIDIRVGVPGDYRLELTDLEGRTWAVTGTAESDSITVVWDGKSSDGEPLAGSISGLLTYDSTPDGSMDEDQVVYGDPYFLGIAARAWKDSPGTPVAINGTMTTLDSPQAVDAQAKLMEDAYVGFAREEFEWNRIEPRNDYFDWAKFDQAVEIAAARNVHIIGKLVYTADWASSAPPGTAQAQVRYYAPRSMSEYTDYVRQVVDR
jgi:hypothetical protein